MRLVDGTLEWARKAFPVEVFESLTGWFTKYGQTGIVCTQVLVVLFCLVAAFKRSSWMLFPYGIGLAILLVVLQYTAVKFMSAGRSLIESSPSRLRSTAFLDCFALLSEITGVMIFLSLLVRAQWSLFWTGLGVWALCDGMAWIAIHPSLTNISFSDHVGAGEEAIGMMSFVVKAVVRLVPIAFGVGAIIGAVALVFAVFSLLRTGELLAGRAAILLIAFCACLPLAAYVLSTFYHLLIDILRAILLLPGKIHPSTHVSDTHAPDNGVE